MANNQRPIMSITSVGIAQNLAPATDHPLHEDAFETCVGLLLGDAAHHILVGQAHLLRAAQIELDAADVELVDDVR